MKKIKLSELKKLEGNPRTITKEDLDKLTKSIEKFGVIEGRPFLVSNRTGENIIIGGNQRYEVCKKLGINEVPVHIMEGLSEEEEREIIIRDNISNGEWDWDILANEWDKEELEEWGLDVQFETVEPTAEEDDFEVDEGLKTDIVLGDLFEIGPHRLLCGDSTNIDDVNKLMNGEKADLLLTDPPYGIGIDGQKESKSNNPKHNRKSHEFRGWDNERPEKETFDLILTFAQKAIIWGGNYFADILPATRGWIYWSKGQDGLTMSDGELAWTTEDVPLRAITVNRATLQGSVHPTQKPIQVMSFCIEWAKDAKTVIDTFGGSGSTMVACHQLNRKCYMSELDPKYVQTIVNRMIKLDSTLEIKRNGEHYKSVISE